MFANNLTSHIYNFFKTMFYNRNGLINKETKPIRKLNYFDLQIEKINSEYSQMMVDGIIDFSKSVIIDDPDGAITKKIVDMENELSRLNILSEIYSSRKFCGELEYSKRPSGRRKLCTLMFTSKQSNQSFKFRELTADPIELDEESEYNEDVLIDMFMELPDRDHNYILTDEVNPDEYNSSEVNQVVYHQPLCEFSM